MTNTLIVHEPQRFQELFALIPGEWFSVTTAKCNNVEKFTAFSQLKDNVGDFFGTLFGIFLQSGALVDQVEDSRVLESGHSFEFSREDLVDADVTLENLGCVTLASVD